MDNEGVVMGTQSEKQSFFGCRLTYQGNVLYCSRHRTFEENRKTVIEAMEVLVGFKISLEELAENGKIEEYRSR